MGGGVLTEDEFLESPPTFTEVFEEQFPYYLHLGMSREEFWELEPWLAKMYRRKYEFDIEQTNQMYFVLSNYIGEHIQITLSNAFKKKGQTPDKYRDKPLRLTPKTAQEKAIEAEQERRKIIAQFTAWGKRWEQTQRD